MMLVRAKGVMWGKVRMQIPDWNPFVTIGIPIDELPEVVLETLPEAEGNHPDFRFNFMADVQGTISTDKDITISDYTVDVSVTDEIWKSFIAAAPDGTPVAPKPIADEASPIEEYKNCTCCECSPEQNMLGCTCTDCIETYLSNLTSSQKHNKCECKNCMKQKHPHSFEKPCLCKECNAIFLTAMGHKIGYVDWEKLNQIYEKHLKSSTPLLQQLINAVCKTCSKYHTDTFVCEAHDDGCTCSLCFKKDDTSMEYGLWEKKYTCETCGDIHADIPSCKKVEVVPDNSIYIPFKALTEKLNILGDTTWCDPCSAFHKETEKHSKQEDI